MNRPEDLAFGPTRYGFNFQWMVSWSEGKKPEAADETALDWLAMQGFNFVRLCTDYRFWTKDFDYLNPDQSVFEHLDGYLEACRSRGLHMALNFHRAPGYCINSNNLERDNLWTDEVAQDGFVYQWEVMARRFKGVSSADLSFDLMNEPPNIGEFEFTRARHEVVMRRAIAAIRAIDPDRAILLNGLEGGHNAIPELSDVCFANGGRGYQPMTVSHYQASWWPPSLDFPVPEYPGSMWNGKPFNIEQLREFYRPWREVQAKGIYIHIGEFGCYNKTPHDVALRWLGDLFALYREFGWGFGMWNFVGPFGIIDHGREGARFEDIDGYLVDRDMLELMRHCMS